MSVALVMSLSLVLEEGGEGSSSSRGSHASSRREAEQGDRPEEYVVKGTDKAQPQRGDVSVTIIATCIEP